MGRITRTITTTTLIAGIAMISAGCSPANMGPTMIGANTMRVPTIVPEKYGLVEHHVIEVDPASFFTVEGLVIEDADSVQTTINEVTGW